MNRMITIRWFECF